VPLPIATLLPNCYPLYVTVRPRHILVSHVSIYIYTHVSQFSISYT